MTPINRIVLQCKDFGENVSAINTPFVGDSGWTSTTISLTEKNKTDEEKLFFKLLVSSIDDTRFLRFKSDDFRMTDFTLAMYTLYNYIYDFDFIIVDKFALFEIKKMYKQSINLNEVYQGSKYFIPDSEGYCGELYGAKVYCRENCPKNNMFLLSSPKNNGLYAEGYNQYGVLGNGMALFTNHFAVRVEIEELMWGKKTEIPEKVKSPYAYDNWILVEDI